jgi:glycosyltransferase involved in cell wall biosynthesis
MSRGSITVIIPVFNEAANVEQLVDRLHPILNRLGLYWDVLFVDDGSTDDTLVMLRALNHRDRRYKSISLSRNFGKDIALAAGLRYANGDAAILMDADLQHPPEIIESFVAKWKEGYQVAYGQRLDEELARPPIRRLFSGLYYKVFNALASTTVPDGAGDFRLLDRRAIDAMNRMGDAARYTKGIYSWIGFRTIGVPYVVRQRAQGGSKWKFRRLAHFAIDGITSFSTLPLRIWSLLGLAISSVAFGYALIVLTQTLVFGRDTPGFPTIIISIMFFAGVQLISLGVLGEYLGRVYEQVKGRPLFFVADEIGVESDKTDRTETAPKLGVGTSKGSVRESQWAARDSRL